MYLGLLDLSKIENNTRASQIRKGVRDQKVVVSCSLPMPVEPTSANFRKFEVDNKHIHLNVYGTLGDEARSPVTHHCMSATTKTSVPRQSTSCSQEMRKGKDTTASSGTCLASCTAQQRVTRRSKCVLTVLMSTSTVREL